MASIGKIQAALAAATNEVTLAAANINFDFTLIKCEAPKEFKILGSALSKNRKDNAECGPIHVTAQRLGALFDGLCPSTPHLLKTYGTRVSEIAQEAKKTHQPELETSMFAAHTGVDGTSIWAAATSSPTALHVQLLACMLARVWPASEAVSVWFELVKERRRQIEKKWEENEALPYATLSAATQSEISRSSLAEWDASARSWLRTADRIKVKQQDQLMLLIANVNIPVNNEMAVYHSVISAWKCALDSMENLLTGMPQAANNGPCLLALSAWHIYPDILAVAEASDPHRFRDPLVPPGGELTLGLAYPGGAEGRGVFWSLSLAHLNYYGRPVSRHARLNFQSRRISFDQFTQAVFRALLSHWGLLGPMAEYPARFFVSLRNSFQRAADNPESNDALRIICSRMLRDTSNVVNILTRAATEFLEARDFKEDLIHKLMAFGSKRASQFIHPTLNRKFFGFDDPPSILSLLKGPEERVLFLRRIASDSESHRGFFLIRYFNPESSGQRSQRTQRLCGFASAHQYVTGNQGLGDQSIFHHARWAPRCFLDGAFHEHEKITEISEETSLMYSIQDNEFSMPNTSSGSDSQLRTYQFVFGHRDSAAIYADKVLLSPHRRFPSGLLRLPTIEDLIWCLDSDMFAMDKVVCHFNELLHVPTPQVETMRALSVAHQVYRTLPDATISTRVMNSPMHLTKWAQLAIGCQPRMKLDQFPHLPIDQKVALACVAYMEGGVDIDPQLLDKAFAIAYEDSIYVSMQVWLVAVSFRKFQC